MTAITKLQISNEKMAWDVLENALKGGYDDKAISLSLDSWAEIHLHYDGGKYNSSVPTGVMQSFLDLQKAINRAAAALIYNEFNALRLTSEDRRQFELVVTVSGGSSNYNVDLAKIFNALIVKAADKMSGKELVILIIALVALCASTVAWKDYLAMLSDQSKVELSLNLSKEETKRSQILKDALKAEPKLGEMREDLRESQHQFLRSAVGAKSIEVQGINISGADAVDLAQTQPERSKDLHYKESFRILAVDTTNKELVKVKIRGVKKEFTAFFKDESFDEKQLTLLKNKLMSREPVHLVVNATMLRDKIKTAEILSVNEIEK
ncbi:hypothetical protein [Candidatus Nitrotoga arctica]|uniref:Uncharacterized protein n=1 Tax=Candidatus Nitrotoga arctica TaxID=453162 RepID=A0ABN8AHK4_9PROT|nr:hypothetical protein [Candidatus Nitrotoga arctica]CAG9932220.1 conserved protein of unknown function [Candidatus Nitrotoga arctica]